VSILPTYIALLVPGLQVLMDVRLLRLLRVFRILKLTAYIREYRAWARRSRRAGARSWYSSARWRSLCCCWHGDVLLRAGECYTSIPTAMYWPSLP